MKISKLKKQLCTHPEPKQKGHYSLLCLLCLDWLVTREGSVFTLFTLFGLAGYQRRVIIYFVWTGWLPEKGYYMPCLLCLDWLITREGSNLLCLLCLDWLVTREGSLLTLFGLAGYQRRVIIYFLYFVWTGCLPEKGHYLPCLLCLDWLITREGSVYALFTLFGLADY